MNAIGKTILHNITPLLVLGMITGYAGIYFLFIDERNLPEIIGKVFVWAMAVPCLVLNVIVNLEQKEYKRRMLVQAGVTAFLLLIFVVLFER